MIICFDTNVVLDGVLQREPHRRTATRLLHAVEKGDLTGQLCATTVTTVYYFVQKRYDGAHAQRDVKDLLRVFDVAPVGRAVLERGAESDFRDYEDAVLHNAAQTAGADGIVSRNETDFDSSTLPVYTPTELLAILDLRGD